MNANYNGIDARGPKVAPMFLFLIETNGKEPTAFSILTADEMVTAAQDSLGEIH